jgi:hypothetical protein
MAILLLFPFALLAFSVGMHLRINRTFAKFSNTSQTGHESRSNLLEKARNLEKKSRRLFISFYVLLFCFFVACGADYINALKIVQANDALTYFSQAMTICRPYMDENQAKMFSSRFASVRGKADFMLIISDLQQLAATRQVKLPDYTPW